MDGDGWGWMGMGGGWIHTTIKEPETPLLAGRPMVHAHSPEKSYIPHEYINCRVCLTTGEDNSFLKSNCQRKNKREGEEMR